MSATGGDIGGSGGMSGPGMGPSASETGMTRPTPDMLGKPEMTPEQAAATKRATEEGEMKRLQAEAAAERLENPPLPPDTPKGVAPEARTVKAMLDRIDTQEPGARPFDQGTQNTQAPSTAQYAEQTSEPSAQGHTEESARPPEKTNPSVAATNENAAIIHSPESPQQEPAKPAETSPRPDTLPVMPPPPTTTAAEVAVKAAQNEQHNKAVGTQVLQSKEIQDLLGNQYEPLMKELFGDDLQNPTTVDVQAAIDSLAKDPRIEARHLAQRLKETDAREGMNEGEKELESLKVSPKGGDSASAENVAAMRAAREKIEEGGKAQRNGYARELLLADPEFVKLLDSQKNEDFPKIDVQSGNLDEVIKTLNDEAKADNFPKDREKILKRLYETRGLALRAEAQAKLDAFSQGTDRTSEEYQKWKKQFTDNDIFAQNKYVREALRQDKGLQRLLKAENYDIEDFNIDEAIQTLEKQNKIDSPLGKRLLELRGREESAVLSNSIKYIADQQESNDLMKKMANADSHGRGLARRLLDGSGDWLAKLSGQEITKAWNDAKGWQRAIKQYEQQLKDPKLAPETRKSIEVSLGFAKEQRKAARIEAFTKRGIKSAILLFLLLSVGIIIGPAILPAKFMDWTKGMGGGR